MSSFKPCRTLLISTAIALGLTAPSFAAASTAKGEISIIQVMAMLDQAPSNPAANQVLTAYLGGIGETVGVMVDLAAKPEGSPLTACRTRIALDVKSVRRALETQPKSQWQQMAATPLIVRDMIKRAGCRLTD
ncbi:chlorophyllide reductase [Phyllobacterium sp. 628]|uniref:chlorophyllide reductase n=1 Tax=Phyllobacterium sp. 628 TaxID=2718938 RepID=UPI0016622B5F|nr:chlorophyllide reductase [Phyllobacterium sp. 628]QND51340.1 chlorophyllide reductase [Phyllobacterium sp. 628]